MIRKSKYSGQSSSSSRELQWVSFASKVCCCEIWTCWWFQLETRFCWLKWWTLRKTRVYEKSFQWVNVASNLSCVTSEFSYCNLSQAKEEDLRLTERNMQASKKKQSAFEVQMNQLREQKVREEPIPCQTLNSEAVNSRNNCESGTITTLESSRASKLRNKGCTPPHSYTWYFVLSAVDHVCSWCHSLDDRINNKVDLATEEQRIKKKILAAIDAKMRKSLEMQGNTQVSLLCEGAS